MTRNRLSSPSGDEHNPAGKMAIGAVRSIYSSRHERTWTLFRTASDYAFDLADAYNRANTVEGVVWVVGKSGEVFITRLEPFAPEASWKPEEGECEWISRAAAHYAAKFPHREPLTDDADRKHYQDTMNKWHEAAPWRQTDQAA